MPSKWIKYYVRLYHILHQCGPNIKLYYIYLILLKCLSCQVKAGDANTLYISQTNLQIHD
jgi:hypothetical protein